LKTVTTKIFFSASVILGLLFIFGKTVSFGRNASTEGKALPAGRQGLTLLITGDTHAMIYHCNCPKEPDGGISRRAALIKELRKTNPNVLLLDSGSCFASGILDEYSQDAQLDAMRTMVNLKGMRLMGYDAVAIGEDEFNFGKEFLSQAINSGGLDFISCNIELAGIKPYIIKEYGALKVGILAVTAATNQRKIPELKFLEPQEAVKKALEQLKKENVGLVVLLSRLSEEENTKLINENKEINVLVCVNNLASRQAFRKIGNCLVIMPSWQGRRLVQLDLQPDKSGMKYNYEEIRVSDKITPDKGILSILPQCFSETNCRKKGFIGKCNMPGTQAASCEFQKPNKVGLLVISPKACNVCDTKRIINLLRVYFPGLQISYLYYPSPKANKLIHTLGIKGLPAYLLAAESEKEEGFIKLKAQLDKSGDYYILSPRISGISYFTNRPRKKGQLDFFVSLYDTNATSLLLLMRQFQANIHFLSRRNQEGKFESAKGNLEAEEYLRAVCVQKYYPEAFWDYLVCRSRNMDSAWWDDCIQGRDTQRIKACAQSEEAKTLLSTNTALNEELGILFGPTYLSENQEIFYSQGVPTMEEFRKTIKR